MLNLRPFQIAMLAGFVLLGIVSIALLATFEGFRGGNPNPYGSRVTIWGPYDRQVMRNLLVNVSQADRDFNVVEYIERDERTMVSELIEAIAVGQGPDAIILRHDDLVALRSTLLAIPYDSLSRREFQDRYIDGSEIFARVDGIYALPFAVDPLIMYWNRDILGSGGFAAAPETWEQLVTNVVPALTLRNATRDILQATVAFGEYRNVRNAKEVLSLLMIQSGSRLVEEDEQGYQVALNDPIQQNAPQPLLSSVQFYTDFSNTNSPRYSWNRSMVEDHTAFLGEELAFYFGYGSEYGDLRAANPNFNFDTALVPQGAGVSTRQTYGTFYGLAMLQSSDNVQGTFAAIRRLSEETRDGDVIAPLDLAPVQRAAFGGAGGVTAASDTIRHSALIARAWLDPDRQATDEIFQTMVEDVVSNRQRVADAVRDAVRRIELSF